MYYLLVQIVPCSKRFVHDWTECPFAHPKEKATRRDPKKYSYTGIACPSMKKDGVCSLGDSCPYAHNVFEYWLHPTRYRTQMCNDGMSCKRKICFFAHKAEELRSPENKPFVSPESLATASASQAHVEGQEHGYVMIGGIEYPMPVRASVESVRQSQEWGPVAMPNLMTAGEGPAQMYNFSETPTSPNAVPPVAAHDKFIIDTVTAMMSDQKISVAQAAEILHHLLPRGSLAWLKDSLQGKSPSSVTSTPEKIPLEHLAALQAMASGYTGHENDAVLRNREDERRSLESARSSFDGMRYSADDSHWSSGAMNSPYWSPNASQLPQKSPIQQKEADMYVAPWVKNPVRHSTGATAPELANALYNADLEDYFNRFSLDERSSSGSSEDLKYEAKKSPDFNPFVSSFFQPGLN